MGEEVVPILPLSLSPGARGFEFAVNVGRGSLLELRHRQNEMFSLD